MLTVEHHTQDNLLVISYDHDFDVERHPHFIHEQIVDMIQHNDRPLTIIHDTRQMNDSLGDMVTALSHVLRPNGLAIDYSGVEMVVVGKMPLAGVAVESMQQAELLNGTAIFPTPEAAMSRLK